MYVCMQVIVEYNMQFPASYAKRDFKTCFLSGAQLHLCGMHHFQRT